MGTLGRCGSGLLVAWSWSLITGRLEHARKLFSLRLIRPFLEKRIAVVSGSCRDALCVGKSLLLLNCSQFFLSRCMRLWCLWPLVLREILRELLLKIFLRLLRVLIKLFRAHI